ncbi:MAG: Mini-ribonuclease 3 [Clostridiales bacterium]|nr:Mini-ribonuclease 3 [Clostridiales bacterium]
MEPGTGTDGPAFAFADAREYSPLQLAYLGDTLHDLYARSLLLKRRAPVGRLHRQAVRLVSAEAQARMLARLDAVLSEEERETVKRGRNAQAKHASPRNQDPADYHMATGLEALWGWLFVRGEKERMLQLMRLAFEGEESVWEKQN